MPRKTILLGAAAVIAVSSLTVTADSNVQERNLQSEQDVWTVCPDGTQCDRGDRCYKTGRTQRRTGLDEYKCGNCNDISNNNNRCEFADEVFCVTRLGDEDQDQWFCTNEGRCINDRVGSRDRPRCECSRNFDGPNCQLERNVDSSERPGTDSTLGDSSPGTRTEGGGSAALSIGAIAGIAVGAFFALIGVILLLLGRRKREDDHSSVISSVENSHYAENNSHYADSSRFAASSASHDFA